MSTSKKNNNDLTLHLKYLVSDHLAGGVSFTVDLLVNTVTGEVIGNGNVTQAISPTLNIQTSLVGEWSWMCTMENCDVLVNLNGYERFAPLIHGHPMPIQNTTLRMSLNSDLNSGTAKFSYLRGSEMEESGYTSVELISERHVTGLIPLAEKELALFKESISV
jgi:hypothetical protein